MSFIRYYKEHQLTFIFNFLLLDIAMTANSFVLFRVPRVKEILGKPVKGFEGDRDVDVDKIPYRDANKGKQKEDITMKRKEKLQKKQEEREERQKQQADERLQAKLEKKKKFEKSRTQKKQRKREADWNEWEDLQREANLAKKLKRGKISQEEYDRLIDGLSDSE